MNYIQEEEFFHIQSIKQYTTCKPWELGKTYFVGNVNNPFFAYYDQAEHVVTDKNNTRHALNLIANSVAISVQRGAFPADLLSFYHCNPVNTLVELNDCFREYMILVRELIFEEIRRESFPHLPSRQKCIWVIPKNEYTLEAINFWWKQIASSSDTSILKLKLTGKIHLSTNDFLGIGTYSLNQFKQNAFKYWVGSKQSKNPKEAECLFEGFAEVIDSFNTPDNIK